jgi:hypothetical protein
MVWDPLFSDLPKLTASGFEEDEQQKRKDPQQKHKKRRVLRRPSQKEENLPVNPVALAAVGAVSVYYGLKGAIQVRL